MTFANAPDALTAPFARLLAAAKADFVNHADPSACSIGQHGCAVVEPITAFQGWPSLPQRDDAVIETFLAVGPTVSPTSDNQPFVDAWLGLATWLHQSISAALADHGLALDGDAYITASLTPADQLEGTPHTDDDSYVPTDNVGVVTIIGQHAGPRVAVGALPHRSLKPMSHLSYDETVRASFARHDGPYLQATADQLVVLAQFGQLHAGPTTSQVDPAVSRQLLVHRGRLEL